MTVRGILLKAGLVDLHLAGGGTMALPSDLAMIHDETGEELPARRLFFGPFEDVGEFDGQMPAHAEDYFGVHYEPRRARIDVPGSGWDPVGRVKGIVYYRPGWLEGDWEHEFRDPVELLASGDWYRLDLPPDAEVNWRGIVRP